MNLAVEFGKKLQEIRKERGLTQVQLAELVNLDDMSISKIECGDRFPRKENIEKFIEVLKCDSKDLFDFSKKNDKTEDIEETKDIDYYKKKIGENIAKFRKEKNISQKSLAYSIGVTPQTLSCIENGINNPSFNVIIKLAQVLNVPLSDIFTFDDKSYTIDNKQLQELIYKAFKDLNYEKRKIAFRLIECLK